MAEPKLQISNGPKTYSQMGGFRCLHPKYHRTAVSEIIATYPILSKLLTELVFLLRAHHEMVVSSRFIKEKADTHAQGIRLLNWNLFYSTTSFESSLIALATLNRFGDVAQTAS